MGIRGYPPAGSRGQSVHVPVYVKKIFGEAMGFLGNGKPPGYAPAVCAVSHNNAWYVHTVVTHTVH